ncbi:MAG: DegT/DnrJ/EryC1/StrS family aminotransferase, partial [Betaproteobacteria bacterium]
RRTSNEIIPASPMREMRRCVELLAYAALYRPAGLRYAYGLPLRRALRRGDWAGAVGDDFSADIPLHRVGRWRSGVGARALARLADFQLETRQLASRRISRLQQIAGVEVLTDTEGNEGTWPFLMVLMPSSSARDRALQTLWSAGLGVSRLFIHALPDYAYLSDCVPAADVPQARDFAGRTLTISNSPWLDDTDFGHIVRVIEEPSGQ